MQFELGWKLFKAPLACEGDAVSASGSPRDTLKAAFTYYDFLDESTWLSMLRDRNNTAHVYDAESTRLLVNVILDRYAPEFQNVKLALRERYGDEITQIA